MAYPVSPKTTIISLVIIKLSLQNVACRHSSLEPTVFPVISISDVLTTEI